MEKMLSAKQLNLLKEMGPLVKTFLDGPFKIFYEQWTSLVIDLNRAKLTNNEDGIEISEYIEECDDSIESFHISLLECLAALSLKRLVDYYELNKLAFLI